MRHFCECVFADFLVGTAVTYTRPELEELLARPDRWALFAVIDQGTGTGVGFTAQSQHGNDGRNGSYKAVSPELSMTGLLTSQTNLGSAFDNGGNPTHGRVRFELRLSGTSPVANVKLYVTGRDRVP
mgnify:CR=1 FL=1